MQFSDIKDVDTLIAYLENLKNWNYEEHQYDFNLIVHLLLALLDNLRANALETEIEDIAYSFNDEQRKFILHLADYAYRLMDDENLKS